MTRKKPYTVKTGVIDLVLIPLTSGFWLFVMLVRELYYRS